MEASHSEPIETICGYCGYESLSEESKSLCSSCQEWIEKILKTLRYPLSAGSETFREYDNRKKWDCFFCGRVMEVGEGYWARTSMQWSQGDKLCLLCFIKFIDFSFGPTLLDRLEAVKYGFGYSREYVERVLVPWLSSGGSVSEYR